MIDPKSPRNARAPATGSGVHGFTLVELLVTMAIFALLLGLGVPALQRMVVKQQMRAASEAMMQSLRFARSEAMRSGQLVTVCRTDDPTATTPACSSTSLPSSTPTKNAYDWSTGWLLFMDHDADGKYDVARGDKLLRVQNALSLGSGVVGTESYVSFQPLGIVSSTVGYSFLIDAVGMSFGQSGYADIARCVVGSKAGRVISRPPGASGCSE